MVVASRGIRGFFPPIPKLRLGRLPSQIFVTRYAHAGRTYLNAGVATDLANMKVSSLEMSLWMSRLSGRQKSLKLKAANKVPTELKGSPLSYVVTASPFRRVLNMDEYYHDLLQKIQPDAIVMAVEDEFREYLLTPDPFSLSQLRSSILRAPSAISKRGLMEAEYDRMFHRLLYVLPYHHDSLPYENYRSIYAKSKNIHGCKVYTAARSGCKEMGMHIDFPKETYYKLGVHKTTLKHARYNLDNEPLYALNNMAKCFNLMAAVDHVKTTLRTTFSKIKLLEPMLANTEAEPVVLIVAQPRIVDLLRGRTQFWDVPPIDIDREDLEVYELLDNCLDKKELLKKPFLRELKYKCSLVEPRLL